jgi:polyphosphate kinase
MKQTLRNKEISWLSFNERLLQEAENPEVPLLERLRFLGIFSNNLDEFFRVRVATLKRLEKLGKKAVNIIGEDPHEILKQIHLYVLKLQSRFDKIYTTLLTELEKNNIFIVDETELTPQQGMVVRNYFREEVRGVLIPIMIDQLVHFPELDDHAIYLAVRMWRSQKPDKIAHAIIEVPTHSLSRFFVLPQESEKQFVILLDDIIRYNLEEIFSIFKYDNFEAYTIKLTRDAELELDDDLSESVVKKIAKGLSKRKTGTPVRFIFDHLIPGSFLKYLIEQIHPDQVNSNFIPGGRYHNFKDFIDFPPLNETQLQYKPQAILPHPVLDNRDSILTTLSKSDLMLSLPYQSFMHVIDLLREAAIDPCVQSIRLTVYRLAKQSKVVNALINAAKNGKEVTVAMELKARFDEEANIQWAKILRDNGIRVVYSPPNFKIHAKLILITRKEGDKLNQYTTIGTGNFNESTAKQYSDHVLLTSNKQIAAEVRKVFELLENNFVQTTFRHLLVSPFNMRKKLEKMIQKEIVNAQSGKTAYIILKLNNLTDLKIIKKLYKASQAGVKIRLMVRGMFSLIPGVKVLSENIEATGIIDRYLEHTRIFVFANGGSEKIFISSADLMPRNLDNRIEVACPIEDKALCQTIRDYLEIHWQDNVKARVLNQAMDNQYHHNGSSLKIRAQEVLHTYFKLFYENYGEKPNLDILLPVKVNPLPMAEKTEVPV